MRRTHGVVLTLAVLLLAAGCQHAPPAPPDLALHRAGWETRAADIEPVRALAAKLAAFYEEEHGAFDASDGLTLIEAEAVTLWYSPRLRVARMEAGIAAAGALHAGTWADPELGLSAGRKREEEPRGVLSPPAVSTDWIGAAGLSLTVPLSGRTGAWKRLKEAAKAESQLAVAEAEWEELFLLHRDWVLWSAEWQRSEALRAHAGLVAHFAQVASALAAAGELDPASSRLFAIERAQKEAALLQAVERERALRVAVLSRMGLASEAVVTLRPEISLHAVHVPPGERRARIAAVHPGLAQLRGEYEAAEAALRLELRKQYPDLTLSPAWTGEAAERVIELGLGLVVPMWARNRAGIAEAAAARDAAAARVEAAYETLLGDLARAEAELAGARARREAIEREVAPLVDAQIAEAQALLMLGEIDVLFLQSVLAQTIETKTDLIEAAADEQLALNTLQALLEPHDGADATVE